jgi:hypothetical protein
MNGKIFCVPDLCGRTGNVAFWLVEEVQIAVRERPELLRTSPTDESEKYHIVGRKRAYT